MVASGTKPEMVAAIAYVSDSAEYRKWSGNRSLMRPPSAAHDIVGRMPPTIIVATRIGNVANCSRKYIGNVISRVPSAPHATTFAEPMRFAHAPNSGIVTSCSSAPIVVATRRSWKLKPSCATP